MAKPTSTTEANDALSPRTRQRFISMIRERSAPRAPLATEMVPVCSDLSAVRGVLFDIYGTLFISGSGDIGCSMATGDKDGFAQTLGSETPELRGSYDRAGMLARDTYFETIERVHTRARRSGVDFPEVDIRAIWRQVCIALREAGFLPELPDDERIAAVALDYELRSNPVWPMPQAKRILRSLHESGYPLGLVSNAQFFTPLLFPALLGQELPMLGVQKRLCAYSYRNGRAKPSPLMFAGPLSELRENHNIRPEETLYVGNDMKNDMMAASQAGCRTCLFAGDRRSLRPREDDEEASRTRPDAVILRLGELETVLSLGGAQHAKISD